MWGDRRSASPALSFEDKISKCVAASDTRGLTEVLQEGNIQDEIDLMAVNVTLMDGTVTSLLGYAALNGALDVMEHLISINHAVNEPEGSVRWPAAHAAAQSNRMDCLRILYKYGLDIDQVEYMGGSTGEQFLHEKHPILARADGALPPASFSLCSCHGGGREWSH
jgi:hypothetical protein